MPAEEEKGKEKKHEFKSMSREEWRHKLTRAI
jgi:hypothetical protein